MPYSGESPVSFDSDHNNSFSKQNMKIRHGVVLWLKLEVLLYIFPGCVARSDS